MKKFLISLLAIAYIVGMTGGCARDVENNKKAAGSSDTLGFVGYAPGVTEEMYQADYWLASQDDADEVQMTEREIEKWNKKMKTSEELCMNDIWDEEEKYFLDTNKETWATRQKSDYAVYREGKELTDVEYGVYAVEIREGESFNSTYGICVEDTSVKAWPEKKVVSDDPEDDYYDDFQVTSMKVNTPVLVNGVTKSGDFYHIVKEDYDGWVQKEGIAICASREEWMKAQEMEHFLMITAPKLNLEVTNQILTMGTKLSVLKNQEEEHDCIERSNWGCYTVEMPYRDDEGHYAVKQMAIPASSSVQIGYVPYTKANLFSLAFQYLGNAYGWGGMYHSVDCSGLIQDVYACFGILLPRDTGQQEEVWGNAVEFDENMSEKERQMLLDEIPVGAQLFLPGHTMLYLGKVGEEYYVISSAGTIMNPYTDKDAFSVRSVMINPLSIKRKNGVRWMDALTKSIKIQ